MGTSNWCEECNIELESTDPCTECGSDDEELTQIEDFESENRGRYIRVSIDSLSVEEKEVIYEFVNSVVRDKKVPKLAEGFVGDKA